MRLPSERIFAAIIDGVLLLIPYGLAFWIGTKVLPFYLEPFGWQQELATYAYDTVTITLVTFLYFAFFEASQSGATIGKRLLGIRVEGGKGAAWRRNIFRTLANEMVVLIGYYGIPETLPGGGEWFYWLPMLLLWGWFTITLFVGDGRTPYDQWGGSRVVRA